ncbi:MAG: tetratricopeptide repeat protein [Acidobacteriota bacterium]
MMKKLFLIVTMLAVLVPAGLLAQDDYNAGLEAFKKRDWATAAASFAKYVEAVPDAYQGHQMLGAVLLYSKQASKAVPHLKKANELKPGDPGIMLSLGSALVQTGKGREATSVLSKLNEGSLNAQQKKQLYALKAKASGGASLPDMKKLAEASPQDAQAWFAYGMAAYNDGQTPQAVSALDKAVGLAPNDAKIRKSHVTALIRQARTSQGAAKTSAYNKAEASAKALVAQSANYENTLRLGEVRLGAKKYSEAAGDFRKAEAMSGANWYAPFYLGQALTSTGDYPGAEAALNKALGMSGADSKSVNSAIGFVYEKQKKYADAIRAYNAAGNATGVARVQENEKISAENAEADRVNREIEALKREQEELKRQMEALPGSEPPPR